MSVEDTQIPKKNTFLLTKPGMVEVTVVTEEEVEKAPELPALSKAPTATATTARYYRWHYQ